MFCASASWPFLLRYHHSAASPSLLSIPSLPTHLPQVRGYLSPSSLLLTLSCQLSLTSWQVDTHPLPGGGVWLRYRQGVDAIWTGLGLPTEEMSYEDRLEYVDRTDDRAEDTADNTTGHTKGDSKKGKKGGKRGDSKSERKGDKRDQTVDTDSPTTRPTKRSSRAAKDLRRAYYRKSLQWHPDRWASMPALYLPAVQGVFELVSGAYQQLSQALALAGDESAADAYA